jgi:hypothetical protein
MFKQPFHHKTLNFKLRLMPIKNIYHGISIFKAGLEIINTQQPKKVPQI